MTQEVPVLLFLFPFALLVSLLVPSLFSFPLRLETAIAELREEKQKRKRRHKEAGGDGLAAKED